ncbi:sterile alpha motif domain-containing protein 1-like [Melitaea cinxia]|uniref:sterile alpha motif domain-containing protein 1-like n=1 Tax=Melitaea cinxia TaxID=113334 RepID=UPI001E271696|nr:sterile alpha motif domain-containing protein 1-like [Melitaea cinxia]
MSAPRARAARRRAAAPRHRPPEPRSATPATPAPASLRRTPSPLFRSDRSPTATRAVRSSSIADYAAACAADRGAAEPPVCGLAEAPQTRSRITAPPPIHALRATHPTPARPEPPRAAAAQKPARLFQLSFRPIHDFNGVKNEMSFRIPTIAISSVEFCGCVERRMRGRGAGMLRRLRSMRDTALPRCSRPPHTLTAT